MKPRAATALALGAVLAIAGCNWFGVKEPDMAPDSDSSIDVSTDSNASDTDDSATNDSRAIIDGADTDASTTDSGELEAIDVATDSASRDADAFDSTAPDTAATDTAPADACGNTTLNPVAVACPDYAWACWKLPPTETPLSGSGNYTVERICSDLVVVDRTTKLMWAQNEEPGTSNWASAKALCAASRLGSFSDWRLPTKIELMSIVDYDASTAPTIDAVTFQGAASGSKPSSGGMWSSSPYALTAGWGWAVDFGYGGVLSNNGVAAYGTRCVR